MTLSWNFFKKSLQKLHTYFLISYSSSVASLVEFTFNRVTKQLSICRVAMSHRIVSSSGFRNNTNNNRWHQQTFCAFSAAKTSPASCLASSSRSSSTTTTRLRSLSFGRRSMVRDNSFRANFDTLTFFVSQSRLRFNTTKEFHQHSPENEPQMKVKIH